jgi:hypothetical protein
MKTTPRSRSIHVWLLTALLLGFAVVATAVTPRGADAKPQPIRTEPTAGDPDTPEAPSTGPVKSGRIAGTTSIQGVPTTGETSRGKRLSLTRSTVLAAYWWMRLRGL